MTPAGSTASSSPDGLAGHLLRDRGTPRAMASIFAPSRRPVRKIQTVLPRNQCDIAFLPYAVGTWQKVRDDGYEGWVNRKYLSGE